MTPENPTEKGLIEAVQGVLLWRVGELPDKGYIRDNDASRHAIGEMVHALVSTRPQAAAPVEPVAGSDGDAIEAIAQFLHDEGGFGDACTGCTWPEHANDTGQRDGGFVRIVPSDVQAKFRDVARRLTAGKTSLYATPPLAVSETAPDDTQADLCKVEMRVVDATEWEPCSPSYLSRGGLCTDPRVWNDRDKNHWHPKLPAEAPDTASEPSPDEHPAQSVGREGE